MKNKCVSVEELRSFAVQVTDAFLWAVMLKHLPIGVMMLLMSEVTELKSQAVAFGSSVPFTGSEVPVVKTWFFLFPAFAVVLLIFPPPPGFFKLPCVFVLTIDLCNLYQFWPQTSFTLCLEKKSGFWYLCNFHLLHGCRYIKTAFKVLVVFYVQYQKG